MALAVLWCYIYIVSLYLRSFDLPKSISSIKKKLGKGKFGISDRLTTDNEIDLGKVYRSFT